MIHADLFDDKEFEFLVDDPIEEGMNAEPDVERQNATEEPPAQREDTGRAFHICPMEEAVRANVLQWDLACTPQDNHVPLEQVQHIPLEYPGQYLPMLELEQAWELDAQQEHSLPPHNVEEEPEMANPMPAMHLRWIPCQVHQIDDESNGEPKGPNEEIEESDTIPKPDLMLQHHPSPLPRWCHGVSCTQLSSCRCTWTTSHQHVLLSSCKWHLGSCLLSSSPQTDTGAGRFASMTWARTCSWCCSVTSTAKMWLNCFKAGPQKAALAWKSVQGHLLHTYQQFQGTPVSRANVIFMQVNLDRLAFITCCCCSLGFIHNVQESIVLFPFGPTMAYVKATVDSWGIQLCSAGLPSTNSTHWSGSPFQHPQSSLSSLLAPLFHSLQVQVIF